MALLVLGAASWLAAQTWGVVNRVSIDRPEVDDSSGPVASEDDVPGEGDETPDPATVADPGMQILLLVGSDSRDEVEDDDFGSFSGNRADVVMVMIKDGSQTAILSLPRDLLVTDPCGRGEKRISAMLEGCDLINGATLLTLAVEETIGQDVDHFALVDLAGFQAAVDALGGYEICVDNPVRDAKAKLDLPAGCTLADGFQTLAWMRSRRTQELSADGWRSLPGMNDLVRNERQRTFLIDMMGRIADVTSPQAMAASAQAVAPFVTVDSDLTLVRAVNFAWTLRGLQSGVITQLEVPVYDAETEGGASVLLPSAPVSEIVADFLSAPAADLGDVVLGAGR